MATGPLAPVQNAISAVRDDLGELVKGMRVLPDLLEVLVRMDANLEKINKNTAHMDREVTRMRKGVDDLGGLHALRGDIKELHALRGDVQGLQAPIEELSRSLHPITRIRGRLTRAEAEQVEAAAELEAAAEQIDRADAEEADSGARESD